MYAPNPTRRRLKLIAVLSAWALAIAANAQQAPSPASLVRYSFDGSSDDSEAWRAYDYAGDGEAGGLNVFYPLTWQESGGVNNSGYVWADDSRWRIDTPEKPVSILAMLVYQDWRRPRPNHQPGTIPRGIGQGNRNGYGGSELDLRNAEVSVYLRGDNLKLRGAKVYFWVITPNSYRWHLVGQPLEVSADHWGKKVTFVLKNDPAQWHLSFHGNDPVPGFDTALNRVISYGFSFVGFQGEVTGKFSIDEFEIKLGKN